MSVWHVDYAMAWAEQKRLFAEALDAKRDDRPVENRLLLCEHTPVYTLGKRADEANLLIDPAAVGAEVFHIERGGDITYHGPGQITGYPILDLEVFGIGLRTYIERLEQLIIDLIADHGLQGSRLDGASGVWLDAGVPGRERKICAIGVRASRFVTMHGFAFNVSTDLSYFERINPCGFTDKGVTSLERETGRSFNLDAMADEVRARFAETFPEAGVR